MRVALDVPLYRLFDYLATELTEADVGLRVCVPFGPTRRIGLIVAIFPASEGVVSEVPFAQLKPIEAVLRDCPPLPVAWR